MLRKEEDPDPKTSNAPIFSAITGRRYYSAELGRWANRDPIEETGGMNLFAFVDNAPTISIDLFGLVDGDWWWDEPGFPRGYPLISQETACDLCGDGDYSIWHRKCQGVITTASEVGDWRKLPSRPSAWSRDITFLKLGLELHGSCVVCREGLTWSVSEENCFYYDPYVVHREEQQVTQSVTQSNVPDENHDLPEPPWRIMFIPTTSLRDLAAGLLWEYVNPREPGGFDCQWVGTPN